MSARLPLPLGLAWALLALGALLDPGAWAQDAAPDLPPLIYVPYDHLPESFISQAGQTLVIPYPGLLAAWNQPHGEALRPPVAAVLGAYTLSGVLADDHATLTLAASVEALSPGWSQVVLPGELPLMRIAQADPRLTLERTPEGLLIHAPGPGRYPFAAELMVPVVQDAAGRRSCTLPLPGAAAGELDVLLPEGVHRLELEPALAGNLVTVGAASHLRCALGGTAALTMSWQPPVPDSGGPLVLLRQDVALRCSDRSAQEEVAIALQVAHRALALVRLQLPAAMQLLAVDGPLVRTWRVSGRELQIELTEPLSGDTTLHLSLAQDLPAVPAGVARLLPVALPAMAGAVRTSGTLLIAGDDVDPLTIGIDAHPGMLQIDPQALGQPAASAAFSFLVPPGPVQLRLTRAAADVRLAIAQLVQLGAQSDRIDLRLELSVRQAGIYGCTLACPQAWELTDQSAEGLELDSARLGTATETDDGAAPDGLRPLLLSFKNRLLGAAVIHLQFHAPASIPRAPAAQVAIGALQVARVLEASEAHGAVELVAPTSWAIATGSGQGLLSQDTSGLVQEGPWSAALSQLPADSALSMAFTWDERRAPAGAAGAVDRTAARAAPQVALIASARARELTVRVEDAVTVGNGAVRQVLTCYGEVRYSPITTFAFTAPSAWDDQLLITGAGIAERAVRGRDPALGLSTWEVRFEQPVLGEFTCTIAHTLPLALLAAGQPLLISLPPIRELQATRAQRILTVARDGSFEVASAAQGMVSLAPGDLPAGLQGGGIVAAYQGAVGGTLSLSVERRDQVRLADASVSAARYQAVLSDDGWLRVHAQLQLESRGRPALEVRLPVDAHLLEVTIDQRQGRPTRREDGCIIIPLPAVTALSSLLVALAYEVPAPAGGLGVVGRLGVELPVLGDEPRALPLPVQQVAVSLYLPEHLVATRWRSDCARVPVPGPQSDPGFAEDGLTVRIAVSGARSDFTRLGGGGALCVWYLRDDLAWSLIAVSGVLTGAGMVLLRRHRRLTALVTILGVLALVVSSTAACWLAAGLASGVILGAAPVAVAGRVAPWWRARRTVGQVEAPLSDDPWLAPFSPLPGQAGGPPPGAPPGPGSATPPPAGDGSEQP